MIIWYAGARAKIKQQLTIDEIYERKWERVKKKKEKKKHFVTT